MLNAAVAAVVAAATLAAAQAQGSYGIGAWGVLGVALVALAALQLAAGLRPSPHVVAASSAFAAFGVWTVSSGGWGGVPAQGIEGFDRLLLVSAALLVGSMLGVGVGHRAVLLGVAAGSTALAAEVLVVLAAAPRHGNWLLDGTLVGPVGYKNAQGGFFAAAVPLTLWLAQAQSRRARSLATAAAVVLLAGVLLSQSRGALAALAVATVVLLAVDRRPGLRLAAAAVGSAAAVLFAVQTGLHDAISAPARAREALLAFGASTAIVAAAAGVLAGRARLPSPRARRLLLFLAAGGMLLIAAIAFARIGPLQPAAAGHPRSLTDLSTRGRVDAWRAAWEMIRTAPVVGHGVGSFARQWPVLRPPSAGHIIQPHSIELETLAELGAVGLILLLAGWVLLLHSLQLRARPAAAAAAASALVLLVQASVDWTWSFPGLVVPVFLCVSAASGGGRAAHKPRLAAEGAVVLAVVAGLAVLTVPLLAHRFVEAGRREQGNAARALADAASARRLNRWDPGSYELTAAVLESKGDAAAAVRAYARAAALAREPFANHLNEARAARIAGAKETAAGACRAALLENPYVADAVRALCPRPDGRVWPLRRSRSAGMQPFAALATSAGCGACSVTIHQGGLTARVPGGFAFRDSAFGILDLGPARRREETLVHARLSLARTPAGPLTLLDLRDSSQRLVYSIFVTGKSRALFIYNPPGGFHADSFVLPLRSVVPLAPASLALTIDLRRGARATVRVNGRVRLAMPGPGHSSPIGATTGIPRYVEAGILSYESNRLDDPAGAVVSGLQAKAPLQR